jgi:hypothetical protein
MGSLITECDGKQTACVSPPRQVRVAERGQLLRRREQRRPPFGCVEVARELEHGGIVERRVALEASARREDEQRTPHGGVALFLGERNLLTCDIRGND